MVQLKKQSSKQKHFVIADDLASAVEHYLAVGVVKHWNQWKPGCKRRRARETCSC